MSGDVFVELPLPPAIDTVDGVARPCRHVWAAVAFSNNKPLLKVLLHGVPDDLVREILLLPVQAVSRRSGSSTSRLLLYILLRA